MRKAYWYFIGYLKKYGLKAIAALALGIAFFSLLLPFLQKHFAHRTTHYVAIIGEYNLHQLPMMIKEQLSDGLVAVDSDGAFIPSLADEIAIDSSGTRYSFTFSTNHYWHDGTLFTPQDINYPLKEVQVEYQDQQIIYQLPEISASFLQRLTEPLLRFTDKKSWWRQRE